MKTSLADDLCILIENLTADPEIKRVLFEFAQKIDGRLHAIHEERTQAASNVLANLMEEMRRLSDVSQEAWQARALIHESEIARRLMVSGLWSGSYLDAIKVVRGEETP